MFGCRHPLQQAGIGGYTSPGLALAGARAGGRGMLTGTIRAAALHSPLAAGAPRPAVGARRTSNNGRVPIATPFTEMFGCRHPLQQAGIGGYTSPDLAIAVARAGALGMLTGTIGAEALNSQLDAVPPDLAVGVNFLVPFL